MSRREAFRFGVRDGDRRAATWVVTKPSATTSDIYVACRELNGAIHFSMHQSGSWHMAYERQKLSELFDPAPDPMDRFIKTWPRPAGDGQILAFRIITPMVAVSVLDPRVPPKVKWISVPGLGRATVFFGVLVPGPVDESSWPGRADGTRLVGAMNVDIRGSLYVVENDVPFPKMPAPMTLPAPRYFRGKSEADLLARAGQRMLGMNFEDNGSLTLFDSPATVTKNTGDKRTNMMDATPTDRRLKATTVALAAALLVVVFLLTIIVRIENERYALRTGMCSDKSTGLTDVSCLARVETRTHWWWHLFYAITG
jgi:hypothetical protein